MPYTLAGKTKDAFLEKQKWSSPHGVNNAHLPEGNCDTQ